MTREFNINVFVNPENYLRSISISDLVADKNVQKLIIEYYKRKILKGDEIRPIIVIGKPKKEKYAVWDGHHRYYAYLELGIKKVCCAYAGNLSGLLFFLIEHGFFQPTTEIIIDPLLTVITNKKHFKKINSYFHKLRNFVLKVSATPTKWSTPVTPKTKEKQFKVLFVCTANSYRSVIAEGLLKKLKPEITIDSAGTSIWRNGLSDSVSTEAKQFLATENAIQYIKQTPEGLYNKNLEEYDEIIVMEQVHKKIILEKCPECENKITVWNIHDKIPFYNERTKKINKQLKKKVIEYSKTN